MKAEESKYYQFLGIIKRAGQLRAGHDAVMDHFRDARTVLLAADGSERLKERVRLRCQEQGIRCVEYGKSSEYGRALGTKPTVILSVTDRNFAEALIRKFGKGILFGGEQFGKNTSL